MKSIAAFVLMAVTFFVSSTIAFEPPLDVFRGRPMHESQGMRPYRVQFCVPADYAVEIPTVQRPNAQGEFKSMKVSRDGSQNPYCFNFDESLSLEEGWRMVCYRVTVNGKSRVIKMLFDPTNNGAPSAFDSRELSEDANEFILPRLNQGEDKIYESVLCQNVSS